MRTELSKLEGERHRFRAVVKDFGVGRSKRKETMLLADVRRADDLKTVVADHLWLRKGGSLREVAIGDVVEFEAVVEPYEKGYVNFQHGIDETTVDYRLSAPSNVRVTGKDGLSSKPE